MAQPLGSPAFSAGGRRAESRPCPRTPDALRASGRVRHDLRAGRRRCQILLDLMVPGTDGRAFREAQARHPSVATIPVVVVSAHRKVSEEAAALGVAAYLQKPLDFGTLVDTVRRHCEPGGVPRLYGS